MSPSLQQQLDAHVPQWRQLTSDPAFSAYLSLEDRRTGRTRRQLFDRAAATGDTAGVIEFFKHYIWRQEMNRLDRAAMSPAFRDLRAVYSREDIRRNYERKRKGEFAGREDAWNQLERSMIDAAREGRVLNAVPLAKNFYTDGF